MQFANQVGAAVLCLALAAQPLSGQEREVRSGVFVVPSATTSAADTAVLPNVDQLLLRSATWSLAFGATAAIVGFRIDGLNCEADDREPMMPTDDPCFLYTGAATPAGWFAGSVTGATFGAVRAARQRGCSSRLASLRALGGALLGVAPGAIIVAASEIGTPTRAVSVVGAPLFAGIGATLALQGCRT